MPRGEANDASEIPVDLVRTLLGFLRQRLELDCAWLSSFRDGAQVFEVLDGDGDSLGLSSGVRASLSESYCIRVIDGRLPPVIRDTRANQTTAELAATAEVPLRAYIGVPVNARDGSLLGMLCAVSQQPQPELDEIDLLVVEQVAELIGALVQSSVGGATSVTEGDEAIRRVVARRDFAIVFQAVHEVSSGEVVGVEALARFPCEPFRPDKFFARAALLGLDVELEIAVVERVLSLVPRLPADVFVAINISPAAALLAPWEQLLTDVDPARIVLEVTEHDAVENYAALEDVLDACRSRGLRIAVDDVGAGFSSFSHVLELGPEFVKIDKSITHNIDIDDGRRMLAQAIGEFARQIGATVIAEGVERQEELDTINAVGIRWAQGYLLNRPKPHEHGFPAAAAVAAAPDPSADVDRMDDRRFALALAHSPIGMAVVGLDGTFQRTNRALTSMLGYSRRVLASLTFQEITHPDDLDADLELVAECLDGRRNSYRMDKRFIAADGRIVWCHLSVVLVRGPRDQPRCFVSQILNVTAERVREADLARQAATDPLTGVANRSVAWNELCRLDESDNGYAVLFCDIDNFRAVNDRRGHRIGDELLVELAERLRLALVDDGLLARWGGDEFLVVVAGPVDDDHLHRLAGRLTSAVVTNPITLTDGTAESATLSVGSVVHLPGDGASIDDVLERADRTMVAARSARSRLRRP